MGDEALEWIDKAVARLQEAGYVEVPTELASRTPTRLRALRRSEFRISWLCTRMHSFVLLWEAPEVTSFALRALTIDAVEWARRTKGGLPGGLQTGIMVTPVAVTSRPGPDVIAEARRLPDMRWAAFAQPMVVDLETGSAQTYAGRIVWGLIYQDFIGQEHACVMGDLAGETMRPSQWGRLLRIFGLTFWALLLALPLAIAVLALV